MNIPRRTFIRAAGISLALPWLDAFAADPKPNRQTPNAKQPPRRIVCICAPLGLHPDNFFPAKAGKDYALSPYLELLKEFRDEFTVISGLAHAGMSSGFGWRWTSGKRLLLFLVRLKNLPVSSVTRKARNP